jgi:hypothetical protein
VTKGLGQATQLGFGDDFFSIDQTSTQTTDDGSNVTNNVQGDCTTAGNCQAGQTTTINGTPTSDGYTSGSISNLVINCTTSSNCQATPPPAPVIDASSKPSNPSESRDATFTWTDAATSGVTFKCKIDTGTFSTCSSGGTNASFTDLALGSHTFVVKAVDTTPSHNESGTDSFTWTIVPYLTFEWTDDGAAAGWTGGVPGSSITLTVGSDSPNTFGQFTLHNFEGIAIGDLAEPSFATDAYSGGVPREEIDFSNGDYVFGYPSQAGDGTDSWQLVCSGGCVGDDGFMSWGGVQTVEGDLGATVAAALVEADGGVPEGSTFVISAFTFDGFTLSSFTSHWHNG